MARGILSGIGLGAVFSVGVAGVVSVLVPVTPQPAPELGTAENVAAPQPSAPQAVVAVQGELGETIEQPQVSLRAPLSEDTPKEPVAAAQPPQMATDLGETVQNPAAVANPLVVEPRETAALAPQPAPLAPVASGGADPVPQVPTALPEPQTGTAADLTTPRPLPDGVSARIEEDAPVLPNPQALAPMIPDMGADTDVAQDPAAPLAPLAEGEETLIVVPAAPSANQQQETDTEIAAVAVQPEATPDEANQSQTIQDQAEDETSAEETTQVATVKPRVLPAPGSQASTRETAGTLGSNARVRIGTPASTLINRSDEATTPTVTATVQAPVDPSKAPPLQRYAQPFENPEGKPLMSVVLIDSGADLDAAEIGLPALSRFPYPVSFAVDVRLIDAADRMERYRAKGFDVLAMVDLPTGARPTDAEVSLSVALNGLPEIVAVMEGTGEGLQGSREVADQVTGILKASGHGLVTQSKGLNSMPKLALKEGVPAAPVFRDFDSQGQQPRVIRRFLDQAAFKAGQEGGVIMLGRLRPETIEALLVWGLADRAGSVALAPVSALLLAQR